MFSKKPEPVARTPVASRPAGGATFSVLGADTTITGDISAAADLHIDGTVVGDIACAALVQGETSEIRGAICADSARLAGAVRGSVTARELVILRTARIEGDVHYDALTIEQGAHVDGRFAPREAEAAQPPAAEAEGEGEAHLILASSNG